MSPRLHPAAPPVYRPSAPQIQTKVASPAGSAPPVYRPVQAAAQPKISSLPSRTAIPEAPPAYRPSAPPIQAKVARGVVQSIATQRMTAQRLPAQIVAHPQSAPPSPARALPQTSAPPPVCRTALQPKAAAPGPVIQRWREEYIDEEGEERYHMVYYHGTARRFGDAISRGIDLQSGRLNLDFNPQNTPGFYVTLDEDQAEDWATRADRRSRTLGHRGAVLEYRVPEEPLYGDYKYRRYNVNYSNFPRSTFANNDERDDWRDLVTQGRAGTLVHDYDFVSGPYLTNPDIVALHGSTRAKWSGHQTALFTDGIVALFDDRDQTPFTLTNL